ncbi:unnamed protein product [Fraxinus pennsylvanica]|uniref:Uncharacterized protein n=1 Tax=Fraxinus pennsylvanica TaxID=56036 RepID=A0AAD2DS25_9LAMI|nr:unnamed protein product [Fraxinus pennsylvanica]
MVCSSLGIHVVGVTCLVAVDVEKVTALNFVFAQRFSSALQILLPQHALCCKMSSIYKQRNVITALLYSLALYLPSKHECLGFMFCLQQLACIFSIIALLVGTGDIEEASQLLNCLSDMTQHKTEMDKRDGKFGAPSVMAVPPVQQMSRIDQPVPPQVGYPSPLPYGQPPNYLPPVYGMPPGYPTSTSLWPAHRLSPNSSRLWPSPWLSFTATTTS